MAGTADDENLAVTAGRGHLRASHADREQVIDVLKAAFAQGRLAKDDFDRRVSQALVSRTYADLAAAVAGLPAGPPAVPPPHRVSPHRVSPRRVSARRPSNASRWAAAGLGTPAVAGAAFAAGSVPGGGGYAVAAFIVAFAYFVFWLSAGADMLWEWHSTAMPGARACVRCAHTAASHRTRSSCAVRTGSLQVWRYCPCTGYVPPGVSPQSVNGTVRPSPARAQQMAGRPACLSPEPASRTVLRLDSQGLVPQ